MRRIVRVQGVLHIGNGAQQDHVIIDILVYFTFFPPVFTTMSVWRYLYSYIRSNETHKNYGKFEGLSVNMGYNFTVYSYNIEGYSVEHSNVYVPRETESECHAFI